MLTSLDGSFGSAHGMLYKDVDRLHGYIKKEEADLDEDLARLVLEEIKTFMETWKSLTVDLHLACRALQDIFGKATISEESLECRMSNPRTVFPEVCEGRFREKCWNLRRETCRLTCAISCGGRKGRANAAAAGDPEQQHGPTCAEATVRRNVANISQCSLVQAVEVDSGGID